MSDDIVTRLREELLGFHNHLSTWEINAERHEAADEIERLRKLISELAEIMMLYTLLMTKAEREQVLKAVRGGL